MTCVAVTTTLGTTGDTGVVPAGIAASVTEVSEAE
jgi:hypothetical protein